MLWHALYVVGEPIFGTEIVGGFYKVQEKNNIGCYNFCYRQETNRTQRTCHLIYHVWILRMCYCYILVGKINLYVSDILEKYKYKIISHLGNKGT